MGLGTMYSVEDLLISHGYKLSRDHPAAREDDREGRQPARTRTRAGHRLLNGYEDGPAALAHSRPSLGKGHVSDSESRRSTPRGHGEPHSTSASRASAAGFYNQPALAWPSQPPPCDDRAYWRRGGQGVRSLLGPREREDREAGGMAQAHSLSVHTREGPWEVGRRTEDVMKKAIWEEELRTSGAAKWQNVSLDSWNQPRKIGRQMSDGDGEKLFQDLYPFIEGQRVLNPQNKRKSQSLPRVLSPEGLSCTEIPISMGDGHLPGVSKMPPYPPNCAPSLESTRNPDKGGSAGPGPRPKFGRPLKPASFGSHQSRGVESSASQDSLQTDLSVSGSTTAQDPRHELCASDSGLEPPVYVPPPSYRSPPQHIPNPYLEDTAPRHAHGSHGQPQHAAEKAGAGCPLPPGPLGTGTEYGAGPRSPRGLPPHPRLAAAFEGSVQYIPFDDPRIRHIKLAQPQGFYEEAKLGPKLWSSDLIPPQEPAPGEVLRDGAVLSPQTGYERGATSAQLSPRWLRGHLPRDGEDGFPEQSDLRVVRGSQHGHAEGQLSSPDAPGERTCEMQTKLRTFETGMQTKKSSKKKTSETIFCLVSIPVKSESHLPATDTNNNDLKPTADRKDGCDKSAALQEQSLLSLSSTDLELQALTGSMVGGTGFRKQDLGEPEVHKQTNDLRFIHLTKHRELQASGFWPGHQYRDQQTQTSFPEESQGTQLPPGAEHRGPSPSTPGAKCPEPAAFEPHVHTALASRDQKQKPSAPSPQGQTSLSPSSNSAFSRTSWSVNQAPVSKACPREPCADVRVPAASPGPQREVVKGEPTGPCNSQQLFGQFLLKPVSRRPWDLISQLESFNKELQEEEEEEDSHSSSEDSEAEWLQEDPADPRPESSGFHRHGQEVRVEQEPRMLVPEDPAWLGRVQSKPESWSGEPKPGLPHAQPQSSGPTQGGDGRGEPWQSVGWSPATEERRREDGSGESRLALSPGPEKGRVSSRSSDTKPSLLSYLAEPREPQDSWEFTSAVSSTRPSHMLPRTADGEERGTAVPLSFTDKSRGLSAPDLRSLGLPAGQEQETPGLDGTLGEARAVAAPPSESLQARAARILGIEVAMESLLPGARKEGQSQLPEPVTNTNTCSPGPCMEELPVSPAPAGGPPAPADAFYGRRKCGWTQSPLFVGERDGARRAPQASEHMGVDGLRAPSPEPQPDPGELKTFDPKDEEARPSFRSTLFHVIERTPSVSGPEKKLRSPSKVIESLQEKLASPPRRADPDRLMRMKEVTSVSRMRFLSSKTPDSTEETEELKVTRGQAGPPEAFVSLNGRDWARRPGHLLPVSKSIISQEENGHPATQRQRRTAEQDFWGPDSYDPSRVERV
ncbi:junctional protein associated with coronary artery disease [Tupaia chinensis]|uniref:junctional protein associated with coronary artery disease n=1 Tax=Tupaia chinensis TaxID=246437 RepID=UPI0003C8E2CB|nr:junctional protein associated with coronary artery disease [Tupaia chinensis]